MTTRKEIYSEEYQKIINQTLANHPGYKAGMEVVFTESFYNMALNGSTMPITSEEIAIILDVLRQVEEDYKLIHI